ncbi:deoxycytidylate deaminase [Variovorax boronicumulans]|uniref:Deoxycytidylate deaminase n=1 Tax=Variovorax boronicumulans TaxID=436515 RepID=A0AAW8CQM8_9BURK|nr:anti-phage dCTP deaminase [Variovorax boronicumulans]MDP9892612.1 deoxycytidylate deaminase [Variovorax boronicumulans]MDQ0051907.1 deoxycytidylate deaminase [Variovorax boronicumulans]
MSAVRQPFAVVQGTFDTQGSIDQTVTDEIVIALCGPMGTPLHSVAKVFKELLEGNDYKYEQVTVIRLSDLIKKHSGLPKTASTEELIDAGNKLREDHSSAVLAQLAVNEITIARALRAPPVEKPRQLTFSGAEEIVVPAPPVRHCHIIDSIKTAGELRMLRSVYGDMLHVIGVYSPIELRIEQLKKKNEDEHVHRLINRDSGEEVKHGQSVRETFPQADFFLRADTNTDAELQQRVRRFLDLMLGTRIITPTIAERAMYAAFSAARNSACLSRQVGAAITNDKGDILATGWNDVPKAFGGLYQSDNESAKAVDDHRCWNKDGGKCYNDEEKDLIARTIIARLVDKQVVAEADRSAAEDVVRKDTQLRGLIEFSRAVHAEMHALLNAGSTHGSQIRGGKLFVTTYPCHSCARHLVAAGVKEVYFVEPYRKSLATKLHPDAITEAEADAKKVRIIPFDGIAPSRFLKFFSAPAIGRKDPTNGTMRKPTGRPVTGITLEAIQTLEGLATKGLESLLSNPLPNTQENA